MRIFSLAAAFYLLFFVSACQIGAHLPVPGREKEKQTEEQKEIAKQKNSFLNKLNSLEKNYHYLNSKMLEKRSRGYNTAEAETTLTAIQKSLAEAKDLAYWENFEELKLKIEEIKILSEKADALIKSAPKFGDKPIKKEKVQRKYGLDDREWVREIRGEPDRLNKHYRSPMRVELRISDPSAELTSSNCWSGFMHVFVIENPPNVESWYYPEDQTIYVFMETNSIVDQFMLRSDLPSSERDQLLTQLCPAQTYSGHKLIYVGPPITDANQIVDQVFAGSFRSADMFGVGALDRLAKATAALPDLSIASIAFNTKLEPLNRQQKEEFDKFAELVKIIDPAVANFMTETGAIQESSEPENVKDKKTRDLMGQQSAKTKKVLEAVNRIYKWQRTLNPEPKDIERLSKLFPENEKEIKEILELFSQSLASLSEQFGDLSKELLKFKNSGFLELIFQKDYPPATFFLLEGVRFEEKKLASGEVLELPDLSVKITVELKTSKKEPPTLVKEMPEIKISTANQFVNAVKESRRLASFGLTFPTTLNPGNYLITFLISDNLRAKIVKQTVNWIVLPD
ncbi:MAG TPA: hypothetical protein VI978_00445 [Candidatus Paceibacterota bacterium]